MVTLWRLSIPNKVALFWCPSSGITLSWESRVASLGFPHVLLRRVRVALLGRSAVALLRESRIGLMAFQRSPIERTFGSPSGVFNFDYIYSNVDL